MSEIQLGVLMMPMHPLHWDMTVTLREDREAIIQADQIGF